MARFVKVDKERKVVEVREAESAPRNEGGFTWERAQGQPKVGDTLPAQGTQGSQSAPQDDTA